MQQGGSPTTPERRAKQSQLVHLDETEGGGEGGATAVEKSNSSDVPQPKVQQRSLGVRSSQSSTRPYTSLEVSTSSRPTPITSTTVSESDAVFSLVNCILGASVLGFPFCFARCGIVLGVVLIVSCLVASQLSMRLLLLAASITGTKTYEELARGCLGSFGYRAVGVCIFVLNLGCLVAYISVLADTLSSVAGSIIPPGAEPSRVAVISGITVFGALPVALLVRSPALLALVSQASVAFILFFSAVLALLALTTKHAEPHIGDLVLWEWRGVLVAFPVVAYGFTAHQYLFGIYRTLRLPSVSRMAGVVQRAVFICTLVYITVGVCGYAVFRSRTSGDVLRNFGAPSVGGLRGAYERLLKLGYGLAIIGTIPLQVGPFYDTLGPVSALLAKASAARGGGHPWRESGQEQLIAVAVLGLALAAAVLVPNVEYVFGLTGSTASALIGFVFPAALFLRASTPTGRRSPTLAPDHVIDRGLATRSANRRKAWALLVLGTIIGVVCTRATVAAVYEEQQMVALAQEIFQREAKVTEALRNEAAAKGVAAAVGAVDSVAESVVTAQQDTKVQVVAAKQADAALESMENKGSGGESAAAGGGGGGGVLEHRVEAKDRQSALAKAQQEERESFALGSVNANLGVMRKQVNTTLATFVTIVKQLDRASAALQRQQKPLAASTGVQPPPSSPELDTAESGSNTPISALITADDSGVKSGPNATVASGALSGAGRGEGEGRESGARGKEAGERDRSQGESNEGEGSRSEKQMRNGNLGLAQVEAVQKQARDTLEALQQTQSALKLAEKAADALERAKGVADNSAEKEAAKVVLQKAINATRVAAQRVDSTLAALRGAQQENAEDLSHLLARLGAAEGTKEGGGEGADLPRKGLRKGAIQGKADLDVQGGGIGFGANSTEAAFTALQAAEAALDTALTDVEETLAKGKINPEVAQRAGEIAAELSKVSKEEKEKEQVHRVQQDNSDALDSHSAMFAGNSSAVARVDPLGGGNATVVAVTAEVEGEKKEKGRLRMA